MNWEGYSQYICQNGHYWEDDHFLYKKSCCPNCKNIYVWENVITHNHEGKISFSSITEILKTKPNWYIRFLRKIVSFLYNLLDLFCNKTNLYYDRLKVPNKFDIKQLKCARNTPLYKQHSIQKDKECNNKECTICLGTKINLDINGNEPCSNCVK